MSSTFFRKFKGWDEQNCLGTASVKVKNRGIILSKLISAERISRAEIARRTKLSAPTVSRIIAELVSIGIIREEGTVQTGDTGAPASMLSFNTEAGYVIGVNIGESVIQSAVADLGGNVISFLEAPTKAKLGGDVTAEQVAQLCRQLLKKHDLSVEQLFHVCVGVPGTVIPSSDGSVTVNAPDINNWRHYPLKDKLVELLGTNDVYIENAQNLAVVCEHTIGCAADYSDVVFVHVKGGIGAGVMINGELFRGHGGVAGEIGFTLPSLNYAPIKNNVNAARHGALEVQIGIGSIIHKLDLHSDPENIPDLEKLYLLAAEGNQDIYDILRETWDYIGLTVVNICAILNPQLVVLGGDILPLGGEIKETVDRYVRDYCLQAPEVKLSTRGNKTCLYGAVQMACSRFLHKLGVY